MKKLFCMLVLGAISFGSVYAGTATVRAGSALQDTTKKKMKSDKKKMKMKKDSTKMKMKKDTMTKM